MKNIFLPLCLLSICTITHSQSFKVHSSNLCGFSVQVPEDATVFAETAEYGIVFRSEYWQKMLCFTPTSFTNPASLSDSDVSSFLLPNSMSPIESSYMIEGKYRVQKIKITNGQESYAGYCIFRSWKANKGIAVILMYGDVNGFNDRLQTLALQYVKGFNNTSYQIINPSSQKNSDTPEYQSNSYQPVVSNKPSYITKYSKYLSPANDNKRRPKNLLNGVYRNSSTIASNSYSDGSSAYMIAEYYYIFLSNGAYCSIKGAASSSFKEGAIEDKSEEIMDHGHWYIDNIEFDGEIKNTVFLKSRKNNSTSYEQWLYHTFLYNQPVLFDREPRVYGRPIKFTTKIDLVKIEDER